MMAFTQAIQWVETAFQHEFDSLLTVSAMAGFAVLVATLIHGGFQNRAPAHWLNLLWLLVMIRFVLFIAPESPTSMLNLLPTEAMSVPTIPSETTGRSDSSWKISSMIEPIEFPTGQNVAASGAAPLPFPWMAIAKLVWLFGVMVLGCKFVARCLRLRKILSRTSTPDARQLAIFAQCVDQMSLRRTVRLRLTNDLDSPAMTGVFRPTILLPDWIANDLTRRQLEIIFVHELTHVRKWDSAIHLVSYMATMLHWFNPLAFVALRRIESCRELICDQQVLNLLGNSVETRRLYGQTILQIAERHTQSQRIGAVLMGEFTGSDKDIIKQRITMLVNSNESTRIGTALCATCIVGLMVVGFTAAQTAQNTISESPGPVTQATLDRPTQEDGSTEHDRLPQPSPYRPKLDFPSETSFTPGKPIGVKADQSTSIRFDFDIPEITVESPEIVRVTPLAPNLLGIEGLKPGVTSLIISDPNLKLFRCVVYVVEAKAADDSNALAILHRRLQEHANKSMRVEITFDPIKSKADIIANGELQRYTFDFKILEAAVNAPKTTPATRDQPGMSSEKAAHLKSTKAVAFVQFPSIVVNFDDPQISRFLKIEFSLQVAKTQQFAIEQLVEEKRDILTNWLIGHAADMKLEDIRGTQAHNRLRSEIRNQFNKILFPGAIEQIQDVLFKQLNVQ